MFVFLAIALTILAIVMLSSRALEKSRRGLLLSQSGNTAIHGEAAKSLRSENFAVRKINRDKGVIGELGVAKDLEYLAHEYGLTVLHDLSIPGSNANIDHILVTSKVIYVIDAKNYSGIVKIHRNKDGEKVLKVGTRNQTILATKVSDYAERVNEYLKSENVRVKVLPLLAFYQAEFHEDSASSINGVSVNVFGIENELLRNANLKAIEIDIGSTAKLLLKKFPPNV